MKSCWAEYYNRFELLTEYEFKAFTKRGAIRKALKHIPKVHGEVLYMQVWFGASKIYGNGNKRLF